ncbi:MAG: hypothetical protein V2I57_03150 [Xanthomonadales bacterium]|nr:hypothetical protein [Xanthomonadales bacterium]
MTDRFAYLEALGIPAFVPRDAVSGDGREAAPPARPASSAEDAAGPEPEVTARDNPGKADARATVSLGAGQGSCLFLAGAETDEASPLASDLARVLAEPPVWSRLADDDGAQRLEAIIAERLFTHVVVFGAAEAQLVFGESIPETCGPARVTVVDDFARLAKDAGARKSCWLAMKASGVVRKS